MSVRFDEEFLRRLEALRLAVRRRIRGRREGDRATPRRGGAGEFHSHRAYVQGDDLRCVDWSVYARLGALFVREQVRDEAPAVHLLLDTSPSMAFGKLDFACELAGALGAIAFGEYATVRLQEERTHASLPPLLVHLAELRPDRAARWDAMGAAVRGRSDIVFLFSDLWDDALRGPVLEAAARGTAALIHVLGRDEVEPPFDGRIRFVDSESGEAAARFVSEEERAAYRALLLEHGAEWRRWAVGREIAYAPCTTGMKMEEAVFVILREAGVIE